MKKKVLSLVLALLMTASAASTVLADDVVAISEDTAAEAVAVEEVEEGPYDKAIAFLAAYDIYKGYSADDPAADKDVQRYQMALLVSRIATGWTNDADWMNGKDQWTNFTDIDVEPVNNYFGALSFAVQNKIIEGYGNGKFGPTDGIKYQDALTMVVRTLGYNTLEWPWGYIQKAVELGLTEGITGVSYQEELTRGEVAQIVYNALFAKMKDGSNLALKNFGIEFGWEKVVITASDINTFNKTKTSDGTGVESKFVEFKLLNDDGSLGDDAYKTYAKSFGLDVDAHEDDLAVGHAYYVLFGKDADSSLVEIAAVEPLYTETLENTGKLNDYEIKDFFDKYALVENYSTNSYVNVTASTKDEVLVWDKVSNITVMEDKGHYIAIDWNTGDILVPVEIKDNKIVDQNGDDKITYDKDWKVEWHRAVYNGEDGNERYYKIQKNDKGEIIYGVDWMSKEEFEKTYADTLYKEKKEYKGFSQMTSFTNTAYAALELFDTDLNGTADRGLYESYALGYFETVTEGKKCDKCNKKYDSWKITKVGTEDKFAGEDRGSEVFNLIPEGTCEHTAFANAWFADGYEPAVDEDGEYVDSYVIYGYDDETKGIKIVKNLVDDADDDNYVATGVLRAYNADKETVTIGEDKRTLNYDDLTGTGFYKVNDSKANMYKYDAILNAYFNQFVKYVVVDGEVVHMELAGVDKYDELIVSAGYAGLSNDGYIVVNGYSTDDLEYAQFRLGSLDGWKRGDAYYYGNEYKYAFAQGNVYKVVSYDAEEDVYYVELLTDGDWFDQDLEVDGYGKVRLTTDSGDDYDSYMKKYSSYDYKTEKYGKDEYVKMNTGDSYIFVNTNGLIAVYTGKLPEGAEIVGDLVMEKDGTYVFVNVTKHTNVALDAYKAGIVLLLEDSRFYKADYNGENAEDWYLLGAVEYEALAFNLLTGKDEVKVFATNKDFDIGYAYPTQCNVLVDDYPEYVAKSTDIVTLINDTFADESYVAKSIAFSKLEGLYDNEENSTTKIAKNREAVETLLLGDGLKIAESNKKLNKLDEIIYKVIELDENRNGTYIKEVNSDVEPDKKAAEFKEFVKDGNYTNLAAFYVFNVKENDVVIYLVVNDDDNVVTKTVDGTLSNECTTAVDDIEDNEAPIVLSFEGTKVDAENYYGPKNVKYVEDDDDLALTATVGYKATTNNGELEKIALSTITFGFDGKWVEDFEKATGSAGEALGHGKDDFKIHYGAAYEAAEDATAEEIAEALAEAYAVAGSCAGDPKTFVKVGGEFVDVTAVKEIVYDCDCDLIKGFTLTLADNEEYIGITDEKSEQTEVVIGIYSKAAEKTIEYKFTVDVVAEGKVGISKDADGVELNDDTLVLANFCWKNYDVRASH